MRRPANYSHFVIERSLFFVVFVSVFVFVFVSVGNWIRFVILSFCHFSGVDANWFLIAQDLASIKLHLVCLVCRFLVSLVMALLMLLIPKSVVKKERGGAAVLVPPSTQECESDVG